MDISLKSFLVMAFVKYLFFIKEIAVGKLWIAVEKLWKGLNRQKAEVSSIFNIWPPQVIQALLY
jgi:hypothetical protein